VVVQELWEGALGGHKQVAALQHLAALVTEFEPSTASGLALPLVYHEECRDSFESAFLLPTFQAASSALLTQSPLQPSPVAAGAAPPLCPAVLSAAPICGCAAFTILPSL
jgi:hypothetical protein